jgi:hypothetical protein
LCPVVGSQACFVAVVSPGRETASDLWGFGCMQDACCWVSMLCLCPVVGSYCLLLTLQIVVQMCLRPGGWALLWGLLLSWCALEGFWLHANGLKSVAWCWLIARFTVLYMAHCCGISCRLTAGSLGNLFPLVLPLKSAGPGCLGVGLLFGCLGFSLVGACSSRLFVFFFVYSLHEGCSYYLVVGSCSL